MQSDSIYKLGDKQQTSVWNDQFHALHVVVCGHDGCIHADYLIILPPAFILYANMIDEVISVTTEYSLKEYRREYFFYD